MKGIGIDVVVSGKKAMLYGTILFVVVIAFLYLVAVVLLNEPLFFIIGLEIKFERNRYVKSRNCRTSQCRKINFI